MENFSFGYCIQNRDIVIDYPFEVGDGDVSVEVEGVRELEVLIPVSELTGKRENPLKLLHLITNNKVSAPVLDALFAELPSIVNDSNLDDETRFNMVKERLATGTPSEDAIIAERLLRDASALGLVRPDVKQEVENKIQFEPAQDGNVETA